MTGYAEVSSKRLLKLLEFRGSRVMVLTKKHKCDKVDMLPIQFGWVFVAC